jgi:hypothetical protein
MLHSQVHQCQHVSVPEGKNFFKKMSANIASEIQRLFVEGNLRHIENCFSYITLLSRKEICFYAMVIMWSNTYKVITYIFML